jgi:hypothetical protein
MRRSSRAPRGSSGASSSAVLCSCGASVRVVVRPARAATMPQNTLEAVRGDLTEPDSLRHACGNAGSAHHFASYAYAGGCQQRGASRISCISNSRRVVLPNSGAFIGESTILDFSAFYVREAQERPGHLKEGVAVLVSLNVERVTLVSRYWRTNRATPSGDCGSCVTTTYQLFRPSCYASLSAMSTISIGWCGRSRRPDRVGRGP